jgi:pimeloyl-ACP methyl ester carboxylesterase
MPLRLHHTAKRILTILASVLLLWIAMDAVRPRAPRHSAEWLQAGDVQVRALRGGHGDTTLLLLPGYGESLMSYRSTFDLLATHYRVIAIDLPGQAMSDKPDGPYDLASYQRRLGDFLSRWTTGAVITVGHSMGGELAALLALDHPDRVVAAVLIAPAGNGLNPIVTDAKDMHSDARGWITAALSTALPPQDPAWLAEPPERADYSPAADPAYRAASTRILTDFDFAALRDSFALIRQPVLLIWGRQDPTIPFSIGEDLAAKLPCRRFVPLQGVLHRPHESNPDTVLAEMQAFLVHPGCQSH